MEGEEEIGSPNIRRYVQMLKHKLFADAIIWEFGYVDTKNRPIINLGMKGMLQIGCKPVCDIFIVTILYPIIL